MLQNFDSDWNEWIDVQNVSGIKNKEKIKLVIPAQPAVGKTISTINNIESSAVDNIQTGLYSFLLLKNSLTCLILVFIAQHTHSLWLKQNH